MNNDHLQTSEGLHCMHMHLIDCLTIQKSWMLHVSISFQFIEIIKQWKSLTCILFNPLMYVLPCPEIGLSVKNAKIHRVQIETSAYSITAVQV